MKVRTTTDGEANFIGLASKKDWVARIQFNGELSTSKQQEIAELFAEALGNQQENPILSQPPNTNP